MSSYPPLINYQFQNKSPHSSHVVIFCLYNIYNKNIHNSSKTQIFAGLYAKVIHYWISSNCAMQMDPIFFLPDDAKFNIWALSSFSWYNQYNQHSVKVKWRSWVWVLQPASLCFCMFSLCLSLGFKISSWSPKDNWWF